MESDIIIIGGGPGGYETALYAAKQGLSVTLFEGGRLGGTCLNEGCIPTKSLCRNAAVLEDIKEAGTWGIKDLTYTFDWQKVIERKNEIVNNLASGIEFLMKHKLIKVVREYATFLDDHTVTTPSGESYTARNIIIATGSYARTLPIEGINLPGVITSKELLDINHIPERLCIIGAGVIGLEFASIFRSFGSEVTILEFAKDIIPNFDTDISKRLKQSLAKKGIQIVNQAIVGHIKPKDTGLIISYEFKGVQQETIADIVLVSVGRNANTETLNLEATHIEQTSKGIVTNDFFETTVPGIYAIGDVNGKCMLAHAATYQGKKVINNILNKRDDINLKLIPSAVFTTPEVAATGLTEEDCKQKNISFKSHKAMFRTNGKALSMGSPDGLCKIIVDEQENIIGCHILGAHAADLIHEITALIATRCTLPQLRDIIHAHPTLSEVIQDCAQE